jgi:hypothetical protein
MNRIRTTLRLCNYLHDNLKGRRRPEAENLNVVPPAMISCPGPLKSPSHPSQRHARRRPPYPALPSLRPLRHRCAGLGNGLGWRRAGRGLKAVEISGRLRLPHWQQCQLSMQPEPRFPAPDHMSLRSKSRRGVRPSKGGSGRHCDPFRAGRRRRPPPLPFPQPSESISPTSCVGDNFRTQAFSRAR